jgi:hypothetical protein
VLAFSRVLDDTEIVVVANTSQTVSSTFEVVVDRQLSMGTPKSILFSNRQLNSLPSATAPAAATLAAGRAVIALTLPPMEVLVLG